MRQFFNPVLALLAATPGGVFHALDLAALTAEVDANEQVDQSAMTLIDALVDEIEALKTDPAALQALVDRMRAQRETLASAVAANTPGAGGGDSGGGDSGGGGAPLERGGKRKS